MDDPVRYASIAQACNCLFACDYQEGAKGPRRGYFAPATFKGTRLDGWKAWFPHLSVEGRPNPGH